MVRKRIWLLGLILIGGALLSGDAETLFAQGRNGLPVAVTMKSSHRFEGRVAAVNGFSNQLVAPGIGGEVYRINDGLRRVYVSKFHVVPEEPVPLNFREIEFDIWQDSVENKLSSPGTLHNASPFNEFGHRVIRVDTGKKFGPRNYIQAITKITPSFVELSSLKRDGPKTSLKMRIGNGAVPVEVIRKLLHNQITNANNPTEYDGVVSYFLQAQQFGDALKELDLIERRFPDRKDRVDQFRLRVLQSQARQVIREMQRRVANGQTRIAKELAGDNMNKEGVAPRNLVELQSILSEIGQAETKVVDVKRKVIDLVKRYRETPGGNVTADQKTVLGQFLAELESELSPSNVARLDGYVVQATDASQKDREKVALAISGWVLGSSNATANFALAQSLLQVRDLVRSYLQTPDPAAHQKILDQLKDFDTSEPRTVASILAQMKPPQHEAATQGYTGETPIEFSVTVPGTNASPAEESFRVLVHLPVDYDPYLRYPLLLTLPNAGQSAESQLSLFHGPYIPNVGRIGRASRNGAIVASVEWARPGQSTTDYTAREHAVILKAMRDCFRKFQIDTDRVFLYGNGVGGNLVYDIGLAHPEHFAGLIPVGGRIEKYAKIHATNRNIPLSIYAVFGEGDRPTQSANLTTWNTMLKSSRYANLILVEYIGRLGNELFPDDIESMFQWMQFQRRRLPDRTGFEFSVDSLRPWDNYYWFLELKGFPVQNVTWPQTWKDGKLKALAIEGEIKPEGADNHFIVKPAKAGRSMTLWLSDDYVNFEKEIRISGRGRNFRQAVTPSTKVMLEDARTRGDRLHPYWARLDCIDSKWRLAE